MGDSGNGNGETKRIGMPLQGGSHGNLRSACSDEQLKLMLDSVKSSKSPAVISYGASCAAERAFVLLTVLEALKLYARDGQCEFKFFMVSCGPKS